MADVPINVSPCDPFLERRMRAALESGKAAAVAKSGQIVLELEGRGIRPLLDALEDDPAAFEGATVLDRIVGRAAAAIYVVGKAACVIAPVMSEGAVKMLEAHGVRVAADEVVPAIFNRSHTGYCPMDTKTNELSDPIAIVQELVATVNEAKRSSDRR